MMIVLGAMLVYLSVAAPPQTLVLRIFILGLGIVSLVMADLIRRATDTDIVLTPEGLRDGRGRMLCPMDNIASVERGPFALKPSNGFAVLMKTAPGRAWQPGLWWRLGRRLGVGGVTPGAQGKYMADVIAMQLKGVTDLMPTPDDR